MMRLPISIFKFLFSALALYFRPVFREARPVPRNETSRLPDAYY